MRRIIQPFNIVERVLRDRVSYFVEIARGEELPHKIADLLTVTVLGLAVFGFVAGLSGRNLVQALISTIKLHTESTFYTSVFRIILSILGFRG